MNVATDPCNYCLISELLCRILNVVFRFIILLCFKFQNPETFSSFPALNEFLSPGSSAWPLKIKALQIIEMIFIVQMVYK